MKPKISVLTLAVKNLKKSVEFYRDGLGFSTKGIIGEEFEYGSVAFFDMHDGLKLALWPQESISKDTGISIGISSSLEFTIGHNVTSKQEVDSIMLLAERAGATITKKPENTFYGGYAGYFQDFDGHLWEIVYNPHF